jgi:hypothetical protein
VQARLNRAVKDLKVDFRSQFWEMVGEEEDRDSARATAVASAWYYCAYAEAPEDDLVPLISFPWTVFSVLCDVKKASATHKR